MYAIVRTDIPLADQLVQVGHACLEAGNRFEQTVDPANLVLLGVPSQQKLYDAIARMEAAGIRCEVFYEPDDEMGHTAVCTEPVSGLQRRVFRRYRKWREPG